jgi:hypothetical protein
MAMVRTVRAAFRLKCFFDRIHNQMHRPKHFRQHGVGFNFEVIGL